MIRKLTFCTMILVALVSGCARLQVTQPMLPPEPANPVKPVRNQSNHLGHRDQLNTQLLQSGDIIFRNGNNPIGQVVATLDQQPTFYHVGMVKIIDRQPFIIHASPASNDQGNPTQNMVIIESIEQFLGRDNASFFMVYRLRTSQPAIPALAASAAYNYAQAKIPFDPKFSLDTDDQLYCTELIWKAYGQAGIDLIDGNFDRLALPPISGTYIFPGSLLASQHLYKVYGTNFKL
jgi:uncharacterized protein YycO